VGERTSYPPGTFSWADLGTTDAASATRFYTELFGWEAEEMPAGEAGTYTMLRLSGRDVAGLYRRDASVSPPAWLSYVTVADADDVVARAEQAGATVVQPPFDVLDAGRTAVLRDPTGAHFALWEPRRQIGAGVVNDPGAMCLNQLNTADPAVAQRFYTEVFGWRVDFAGTDEQAYWGLFNDGRLNGGMMPLPPGSPAPSHWLVYFTAADLDATAAAAEPLGGRLLVPPTAVPAGRIAVVADPQGAVFALFEGRVDQ
jgi:predicted enzyme related to lactoylglutathione lyase